ncbi:MAG: ribokinase [Planctomycetota bacterium]
MNGSNVPAGPLSSNRANDRVRMGVIGSINLDLIIRTPDFPEPGETVLGGPFETAPGGKGANQAIAAARLGADVVMLGRVGDDDAGRTMRRTLEADRVRLITPATPESADASTPGAGSTGVAVITVNAGGENTIVVAPGANATLTPDDVDRFLDEYADAFDVVLMQLEVPPQVVSHAVMQLARKQPGQCRHQQQRSQEQVRAHRSADFAAEAVSIARPIIALNAAPAPAIDAPLSDDLLRMLDVLIVNQTEAWQVLQGLGNGQSTSPKGAKDNASAIAVALLRAGPSEVVLTLGAEGAIVAHRCAKGELETAYQPAFHVRTVDTTAAGDAFSAAYCLQRAAGQTIEDALRFACAAGSLAASRPGATPSLPNRAEVEAKASGIATV